VASEVVHREIVRPARVRAVIEFLDHVVPKQNAPDRA
jgi:hypothetical protein